MAVYKHILYKKYLQTKNSIKKASFLKINFFNSIYKLNQHLKKEYTKKLNIQTTFKITKLVLKKSIFNSLNINRLIYKIKKN